VNDVFSSPERLSKTLGYEFQSKKYLLLALTHSSYAEEATASNERLEFLGDRVLGLIVAEILLDRFPSEREGEIARRLSSIVDKNSLAKIARSIELGKYIRVGSGDLQVETHNNPGVLADTMEALIGAVYCDSGLNDARALIVSLWTPLIEEASEPPVDPKTRLQEWAQKKQIGLPKYRILARIGPDHEPVFTVEVSLDSLGNCTGIGRSKRTAEQNAATKLLELIGASDD